MNTADPDDPASEFDQETESEFPKGRRRGKRKNVSQVDLPSPVRLGLLQWLARLFLLSAILAVLGYLWTAVLVTRRPTIVSASVAPSATPTRTVASPTRTVIPSPTPNLPLIGIVAGHSGGIDPGAVCSDGLREVDVTTDVAARARGLLEGRGYRVDILKEFDPRLDALKRDYAPRAFLSIHADSCVYYASGYKVARAANSASPDEDDRLVRCVTQSYAAATLLPFHAGSITNDMTQYHALNKIDPKTPAGIIELGFLGSEHDLLRNKRDVLAQGVASGLDSFMQGQGCRTAVDAK